MPMPCKRNIEMVQGTKMYKDLDNSFDGFLAEVAMRGEATAIVCKRAIAWQIEQEKITQKLMKSAMARKMNTSRPALDRLLNETETSLTLTTLASAASALGKSLKIELSTNPVHTGP
jgi:hypothetical protein